MLDCNTNSLLSCLLFSRNNILENDEIYYSTINFELFKSLPNLNSAYAFYNGKTLALLGH